MNKITLVVRSRASLGEQKALMLTARIGVRNRYQYVCCHINYA